MLECTHPDAKRYIFKNGNRPRCVECAKECARFSYLRKKTFLGVVTEEILESLGRHETETPDKFGKYTTTPVKTYSISGIQDHSYTWSDHLTGLKKEGGRK